MKEQRKEMRKVTKKTQNEKYYKKMKENMKTCEICACAVVPSYWAKHCETQRHKKWSEYQKNKLSPRSI